MRTLLAAAISLTLLGTGCVVVPVAPHRSAVTVQKCPPGHQWSDGRCHSRGRGHDPEKH